MSVLNRWKDEKMNYEYGINAAIAMYLFIIWTIVYKLSFFTPNIETRLDKTIKHLDLRK